MQDTPATNERRSGSWLLPLCVFAAAILVRQCMWKLNTAQFDADPDRYRRIAESVAQFGVYGVDAPWGNAPRPTAYRPPLYTLLVAACCLYEGGEMSLLGAAQVVLGAATVALTFWLALAWGLPRRGALLAAALVALDPILLKQSVLVMTETLAAFLATASLCLLTALGNRPTVWRALAAGGCLALCVLCRPTFLIWAGLCGLGLLMIGSSWRSRLTTGAAFALGLSAVLSPWVVRNSRVFGRPIVTTTHGGYTFWLGNNPGFYTHLRAEGWSTPWQIDGSGAEFPIYVVVPWNELERDEQRYDSGWKNIRAEPGMFLVACCYRLSRLWGICPMATDPHESAAHRWLRYSVAVGYAVEFALAIWGCLAIGRRWFKSPWLWGLLLVLSFTAVHTVYWTDMRMRAPLTSVIALAAAAGLTGTGLRQGRQTLAEPVVTATGSGQNLP